MKNSGLSNEMEIIREINNKRVRNINAFLKKCIYFMFDEVDANQLVFSDKYDQFVKADIYVEINNVRKYISIKTGKSKSVHSEGIKSFILFLRDLGVSTETQKTILLFQYGDGTMNGTGKNRLNHDQLMVVMKDQIQKANEELSDKEIIRKTIERFLFTGGYPENGKCVDFIIHGTKDHGVIVSRQELIDYSLKRKTKYIRTLHIGPITIRPYMRDIEYKSFNTYKRDIVHGDWKDLSGDMMVIEDKRNSNNNLYNNITKKIDIFSIFRLDRHYRK